MADHNSRCTTATGFILHVAAPGIPLSCACPRDERVATRRTSWFARTPRSRRAGSEEGAAWNTRDLPSNDWRPNRRGPVNESNFRKILHYEQIIKTIMLLRFFKSRLEKQRNRRQTYIHEQRTVIERFGPTNEADPGFSRHLAAVLDVELIKGFDMVGGKSDGNQEDRRFAQSAQALDGLLGLGAEPRQGAHFRLPNQAVGPREVQLLHHPLHSGTHFL